MTNWIYDRAGQPTLILDEDCIRNSNGQVIGWLNNPSVYNLNGQHLGWFEEGILTDSSNAVIGFTKDHTGWLPYKPGLAGTPGTPGFAGLPGRPGLAGTPGKPGRSGWSSADLNKIFNA
jgi:hypothetical protein